MAPGFVGVTGLQRAGSTLLRQLLAQHPGIHCEGHSSPLCDALLSIRRIVSDDQFFLSQLDNSFESSYAHLASAMQGFLRGGIMIAASRWWSTRIAPGCTRSSCCCTSSPKRS